MQLNLTINMLEYMQEVFLKKILIFKVFYFYRKDSDSYYDFREVFHPIILDCKLYLLKLKLILITKRSWIKI